MDYEIKKARELNWDDVGRTVQLLSGGPMHRVYRIAHEDRVIIQERDGSSTDLYSDAYVRLTD